MKWWHASTSSRASLEATCALWQPSQKRRKTVGTAGRSEHTLPQSMVPFHSCPPPRPVATATAAATAATNATSDMGRGNRLSLTSQSCSALLMSSGSWNPAPPICWGHIAAPGMCFVRREESSSSNRNSSSSSQRSQLQQEMEMQRRGGMTWC